MTKKKWETPVLTEIKTANHAFLISSDCFHVKGEWHSTTDTHEEVLVAYPELGTPLASLNCEVADQCKDYEKDVK